MEILRSGLWGPSGDNCQPFEFEWANGKVDVFLICERSKHYFNRNEVTSMISLGCYYVHINSKAKQLGCGVDWEFYLDDLQGKRPKVASFYVSKKPDFDFPIIGDRFTDRRMYQGGRLNQSNLSCLSELGRYAPGVNMHWLQGMENHQDVISLLKSTETYVWRHKESMMDLLKWIRMDDNVARVQKDGLPWRNLGISWLETRGLSYISKWPWLSDGLRPLLVRKLSVLTENLLLSSAGMVLFTVSTSSRRQMLEVGILGALVWAKLGESSFSVQPMTSAAISIYYNKVMETELVAGTHVELQSGEQVLAKAFGFDANQQTPLWLFRFGRQDDFPEEMRTFRRDEAILNIKDPSISKRPKI